MRGHRWYNWQCVRKTMHQCGKKACKRIWSKEKSSSFIGGCGEKSQLGGYSLALGRLNGKMYENFCKLWLWQHFRLVERCVLKCVLFLRSSECPDVSDFLKFILLPYSLLKCSFSLYIKKNYLHSRVLSILQNSYQFLWWILEVYFKNLIVIFIKMMCT